MEVLGLMMIMLGIAAADSENLAFPAIFLAVGMILLKKGKKRWARK